MNRLMIRHSLLMSPAVLALGRGDMDALVSDAGYHGYSIPERKLSFNTIPKLLLPGNICSIEGPMTFYPHTQIFCDGRSYHIDQDEDGDMAQLNFIKMIRKYSFDDQPFSIDLPNDLHMRDFLSLAGKWHLGHERDRIEFQLEEDFFSFMVNR